MRLSGVLEKNARIPGHAPRIPEPTASCVFMEPENLYGPSDLNSA